MVFGTFVIGLREGLEAALVVGILVAYIRQLKRSDVLWRLWAGVFLAAGGSLAAGAILTFGTYGLTFKAQETIGGLLSLLAVALVTWMIFWMQRTAATMKTDLQSSVQTALSAGGWSLAFIGFVSVAREGLETALFVWSAVQSSGDAPAAWMGAVLGLVVAVIIGWLIYRGAIRLNLATFFTWTGAALIVVAAGVLAYAIHDLQEAAYLPGPWTAAPDGAGSFVQSFYGAHAWAFQVSHVIAPDSLLAALLQGTVGFVPDMTKLQIIGWTTYMAVTATCYIRAIRRQPAMATGAGAGRDQLTPTASSDNGVDAS